MALRLKPSRQRALKLEEPQEGSLGNPAEEKLIPDFSG
jgi:hypothetical protein